MKWTKASERTPEIWAAHGSASKRLHLKTFGQYTETGRYLKTEAEEYFELPETKMGKESFHLIEWLDESPPASIEDEAARLYPDGGSAEARIAADYSLNDVRKSERSAHITCAGMYTGEIDKLKAENSKMRLALEEIVGYRFDPDKVTRISNEALKTNSNV